MSNGAVDGSTGPLHVAIVGGGISGLSTAWYVETEAAARGIPVKCSIYETTDRWGGRIRTDIVDREEGRFVVEGGPDSFLTAQKPWAVDLAEEVGLAHRLLGTNDAARKVYVLSHGRPVPLPEGVFLLLPTKFRPFLLSPLISPMGKLRMGMEVFVPPRAGTDDETLGDFVTRRLGSEALDKIAEPLLSGIYNAEAQRQSLLATFPRFRDTEVKYGSLIRGMLAARAETRAATRPGTRTGPGAPAGPANGARPRSMFVSFLEGTEEIVAALTRSLKAELHAGVQVKSLRRDKTGQYLLEVRRAGAGAAGVAAGGAGAGDSGSPDAGDSGSADQAGLDQRAAGQPVDQVVRADAVILAIPAYDAADLVAAVAPQAAGGLRTIRYVSTGTLSLAYRRDASVERLGGFGVLVPRSEKRPLNAVTWSSTKFDHRAPQGHSLLRVFFGGSRSPGSMLLDDDELLAMMKKQLGSIMGITREPLFHRIYRWERANPQYDVEHLRLIDAIERALPAGVWVTGSPYRGVGLPDCVHQGRDTAIQVVERLQDLQRSQQ